MVVGKVVAHLCLTLIIQELKFSVEHDRVVTTLNIIFSVAIVIFSYLGLSTNLFFSLLKTGFQSFGD